MGIILAMRALSIVLVITSFLGCNKSFTVPNAEGVWFPHELACKRMDEPTKRQFLCLLPLGISLDDLVIEGQQGYFQNQTSLIECSSALNFCLENK